MSKPSTPFAALGRHLKYVREQSRQSLAEVSGAVEIDEQLLERIEAGEKRPAEDILLLLISHFGVADQEAAQLWELAGYEKEMPEQLRSDSKTQTAGKPVVMLLALDTRTVYADGLDIHCAPAGLTLTFTQTELQPDQLIPAARVGMNYEQAAQVVTHLQTALLKAKYARGPRTLPPKSSSSDSSSEKNTD